MKPIISVTSLAKSNVCNDLRWALVTARDPDADGQFFYGVSSTGIYCRPSCPSRLPRAENVQFFITAAEAEVAGFRPCQRCKPERLMQDHIHADKIIQACRLLDAGENAPGLAELAAHSGLSKDYFQRVFKRIVGLTPKAYAQARRAQRLREQLAEGSSVSDAIFAAGYNASSRFYTEAKEVLGMTASSYRKGGSNAKIRFAVGECSLGAILVAQSEQGICAILMGDEPAVLVEDLQRRFRNALLMGGDSTFEQVVAQVVGFVEAPGLGLDLPLDIRGTVFQQRVWQALCEIPPGTRATYSEIANRIGAPKSFRAVALACGANPLAVAIPCHRVVRNDGGLSGYRWGIERKRALLETELQQAQLAQRES
ncbi:MAG TPA: bifunctional DNA-binding transcriptional regulator/O6-methylguanine-DNA methyltransferase Ada [Cellvibrio sp.]|nr:bifunctional DNA-binding transcriptional regulator/O6-methylguanine-DNA methyltransferase Ada [Cellvibrio sp.]